MKRLFKENLSEDDCPRIGTLRISQEDYSFLEEQALERFGGSIARAARFSVKFAKENVKGFEDFFNNYLRTELSKLKKIKEDKQRKKEVNNQ
jgi:phage FluMu gp28-like protein